MTADDRRWPCARAEAGSRQHLRVRVVTSISTIALLAALGGSVSAGAAHAARTEASACATAQALTAARLVERALDAYAGPATSCDKDDDLATLRSAAAERDVALADARAAVAAKDTDAATLAYLRALEADAGSTAATKGLVALDPKASADASLAGARRLLDAGFRTEAKAELTKQVLAGAPFHNEPDNKGLWELAHGRGPHPWDTVRTVASDIAEFVVAVAIALAIAAAVVLALWNLVVLQNMRRSHRRRKSPKDAWFLTRRWRRTTAPVLSIVAGAATESPRFAAEVRGVLRAIANERLERFGPLASTPETEAFDLDALTELDSRLGPLAAAMKFVFRRDTVHAQVDLFTEDAHDCVAIVELSAPKAVPDSLVLRHRAHAVWSSPPALVGHAAGWLIFAAERLRPRLRASETRDEEADRCNTFGTKSPDSYAAYLSGVQCYLAGDRAAARDRFAQAIAQDPANMRAQVNLALTEVQDSVRPVREAGRARFRAILKTPLRDTILDADVLRARYNLACSLHNEAFYPDDQRGMSPADALADAFAIERALLLDLIPDRSVSQQADGADDVSQSFKEQVRDATIGLTAGTLARHRRDRDPAGRAPAASASARQSKDRDRMRKLARWSLDRAHDIDDVSPTVERLLLGSIQVPADELTPRLAYNLCCYFTSAHQHDAALRHLAIAAASRQVSAWAPSDPVLTALHDEPLWKVLFPPPPPPKPPKPTKPTGD